MKTIIMQKGVTFGGFIMVAALLVGVALSSMKLIPAYMENGKIQRSFNSIVQDPAMQNATVAEIRDSFYKRSNVMDNVTALNSGDLVISKEGNSLSISATYSVKIPFAGNVSLVIDFHPSAPK
jgi:hypothetical protein